MELRASFGVTDNGRVDFFLSVFIGQFFAEETSCWEQSCALAGSPATSVLSADDEIPL